MKYTKNAPDFVGVAATGTAVVDLTAVVAGKCLEAILLILGGGALTRAMITGWRLKGDGTTLRESTAVDTDTIYKFFGYTNAATELLIDFMAPWAFSPMAKCQGAWDLARELSKVNIVTLEVDIAGATTPSLKATVELSDSEDIPAERPFRWVLLRERRAQIALTASGETNIAAMIPGFLPVGGGSVYREIHLFAANITDIRVVKNSNDWFKAPVSRLQALQKRAKRVPQSNHVCFDPGLDGLFGRVFDTTSYDANLAKAMLAQGRMLPGGGTCENAEFNVTMSGAETFWVQTQELALVPNT